MPRLRTDRDFCGIRDLSAESTGLALTRLAGPLENLLQIFATHSAPFGLVNLMNDDRAPLAPRLAAATLLLRFEVEQLAGLQVTWLSRFRD
jgi:hypothetical protein